MEDEQQPAETDFETVPSKMNVEVNLHCKSNSCNEINEIESDLLKLVYKNKFQMSSKPVAKKNLEEINYDFDIHYDLNKGTPIKNLSINIGESDLPRFSCACHKVNLAVRHSISRHSELCSILKKLNSTNAHIRRSIKLTQTFKEKKCKLRLENLTRWSSAYLLLESVKKAYDRNLFNEELKCPVDLKTIEMYLFILLPVYQFSIGLQHMNSSISDVLLGLWRIFNLLERFDENDEGRFLCL